MSTLFKRHRLTGPTPQAEEVDHQPALDDPRPEDGQERDWLGWDGWVSTKSVAWTMGDTTTAP